MPHYTLRQLEYLVACVDHGSIAGAAGALNVSQPTISVAIGKLEAQFGAQLLLRRHAQGVAPTAEGREVLTAARNLLWQAADLERRAMQGGDGVAGEIRLGSFSTLAPVMLPRLIRALGEAYPDVRLRIREGTQADLLRELHAGRIDVALLYDLELPDDFRRVRLAERAPYAALPAGHRLALQADVSLEDLAEHPLILLDIPPSREYFLGLFRAAGLTPRLAHTSPSLELVRGMVGQGLGYSILVTRPAGDLTYDGGRIAARPLRGSAASSVVALATLASLRPTRLMTSFEAVATRVLGG